VRDNFLTKRSKALEDKSVHPSSTSTGSTKPTPIPKQYGRQANHTPTQEEGGGEANDTLPSSKDSDDEEDKDDALNRIMKSYTRPPETSTDLRACRGQRVPPRTSKCTLT
jgi:hypothetical protein